MSRRIEQKCDGCGKVWFEGDRGGIAEPVEAVLQGCPNLHFFHACSPDCVPKVAAALAEQMVGVFHERQRRIESAIRAMGGGGEPPKKKGGGGEGAPS